MDTSLGLIACRRAPAIITAAVILCGCQQSAQVFAVAAPAGEVPEWADTGNFRFARWDGGPIEAAKGTLSGWPGFVPLDPQVLYATQNWYEPGTIDLIDRAHVNWIWVTWSNGFSNQTEEPQHVLLRKYIEACHQHGIRVTAYISIGNIFWQDMFQNVPESKNWILRVNGQPVPYPAADYTAVGYVSRYMADLSLEAWQEYTLGRVTAAVTAGADGIMFDNSLEQYGRPLLEQFTARALAAARKINPQVLMMSNYADDLVFAARSLNAITSESGWEPGVFDSPGPPPNLWNAPAEYLQVSEGVLVLNAGLLRALWAISQGVRPVAVEYGNRHTGDRFLNPLPPGHQKLALAECAAFHAANEQMHEGYSLRNLFYGQAAALENWQAVAQYNAFFQQNEQFYEQPVSMARVAVIIDENITDRAFLDTLAAHNLIYDVVFTEDATPANLASYQVVIAAPSIALRPGWTRYENIPPAELEAASPGSVTAPDTVVVNFNAQSSSDRVLIHLLNYADSPVTDVELKVNGRFTSATLLSPDIGKQTIPVHAEGQFTLLQVPELRIYDLLVLDP